MSRANDLQTISEVLESWIEWEKYKRNKHGDPPPNDETNIMSPPEWPSVGVLKRWIKVLRDE